MLKRVLFLAIALPAAGLFLSLVIHLLSLFGLNTPFKQLIYLLHIGAVFLGFPTVILGILLTKDYKRRDSWKAALRGCPSWVHAILKCWLIYSLMQFVIFFFLTYNNKAVYLNPLEYSSLRILSCVWIYFYFIECAIIYSASQIPEFYKTKKCPYGHAVAPTSKFCPECGQSIPS